MRLPPARKRALKLAEFEPLEEQWRTDVRRDVRAAVEDAGLVRLDHRGRITLTPSGASAIGTRYRLPDQDARDVLGALADALGGEGWDDLDLLRIIARRLPEGDQIDPHQVADELLEEGFDPRHLAG
jgi:hypothetical protein